MQHHSIPELIGIIAIALLGGAAAQDDHAEAAMTKTLEIPESIRREHEHFVREEEIALPPLGLLRPLSAGEPLPKTTLSIAGDLRGD
jgi:hypothetical protein